MPITLDDSTFDNAVLSGTSVVKFGGAWCPNCPPIDTLVSSIEGTIQGVRFYKVDVQSEQPDGQNPNPKVTFKYGIGALPAVVVIRNGLLSRTFTGRKEIESNLVTYLSSISNTSSPVRAQIVSIDTPSAPLKNMIVVQPDLKTSPTRNTQYAQPSNQDSGSTSDGIMSFVSAFSSALGPIAAAKQAKAAQRQTQQQGTQKRNPPQKPTSNIKYVLIGGGVLATIILLYAASRE